MIAPEGPKPAQFRLVLVLDYEREEEDEDDEGSGKCRDGLRRIVATLAERIAAENSP